MHKLRSKPSKVHVNTDTTADIVATYADTTATLRHPSARAIPSNALGGGAQESCSTAADAATAERTLRQLLSRATSGAAFPLPRGTSYPAFDGYPRFVVDWQRAERAKVMVEMGAVAERQELLEHLAARAEALTAAEEQAQV